MINEKSMTKTLDPRTRDTRTRDTRTRRDKPYWYIDQDRQVERIYEVLAETGWSVNQFEISELQRNVTSPDGGLVVSSLILPAKNGKEAFCVSFWGFARYLEKKGILKIDLSNKWGCKGVHLLENYLYVPGMRLISMNLNSNRGLSVMDSLENTEEELRMAASVELLWMLIVFPRFAEAIRNGDVSPFNLSGCYIGDGINSPKESVIIGPVEGQDELAMRVGDINYYGPNWTSPTAEEL